MKSPLIRHAAVAGQFYPGQAKALQAQIRAFLEEESAEGGKAFGAIVPHAGLVYSGACAARVFGRLDLPPVVVILAPNHTGYCESPGASLWEEGAFETPLGEVRIADDFAASLAGQSRLVENDPAAHRFEHAIEVELPFLQTLSADSAIVPIIVSWTGWDQSRELAGDLAALVREWPEEVLLVASSDMTHFESANRAAIKDRLALEAVERLDGQALLSICEREGISMCGRAPAATVLEASRQLGATRAELVDYRHSGWVSGDDSSVVAYAGVVIR